MASPPKPGGLSVDTEQGSLSVSVDWDDVAGADDYLVRWRIAASDDALYAGVRPTSSNADITVADYGTWVVQVQACNGEGCGSAAALQFEVEPEPAPDPPAAPTGLEVSTTINSLDMSVTWDAVEGAEFYSVLWKWLDGARDETVNVTSATDTGIDITVDRYGRWRVQAGACRLLDDGKESVCGAYASQEVVLEQFVPAQPQSLAVSATPGELDLAATWDAVTGADSYSVSWRRTGVDFESANLVSVTAASAGFTVSGYGEWVVRVRACHGETCGQGAYQRAHILPGQPQNLTVGVTAGSLNLSVTWDAAAGADSYKVRWRAEADTEFPSANLVNVTAASAAVTVSGYGEWVVSVEGCNDSGCGLGASQTVMVVRPVPARPGNLSIALTSGLDLLVFWDRVAVADSYKVRWRKGGEDFDEDNLISATVNNATITVSDPDAWVVRVEACNDSGCGPGVVETVEMTPAQPHNLAVSSTPGELRLAATWDAAQWASRYRLQWRPSRRRVHVSQHDHRHRDQRQHHCVRLRRLGGVRAKLQRRRLHAGHVADGHARAAAAGNAAELRGQCCGGGRAEPHRVVGRGGWRGLLQAALAGAGRGLRRVRPGLDHRRRRHHCPALQQPVGGAAARLQRGRLRGGRSANDPTRAARSRELCRQRHPWLAGHFGNLERGEWGA